MDMSLSLEQASSSTLCSFVLLEPSSPTLLGGIHVAPYPITTPESIFIFFASCDQRKMQRIVTYYHP